MKGTQQAVIEFPRILNAIGFAQFVPGLCTPSCWPLLENSAP